MRWSSSASPIAARRVVLAQPLQELALVEVVLDEVGAEQRQAAVEAHARLGQQLQDRAVELHDLLVVLGEDQPRAPRRARPPRALGVDAPRAGHPQVRVDRQVALEAQEQVLAVRGDRLDGAAAEALGPAVLAEARVRRGDGVGDRAREHRADAVGRVVDGVALGHLLHQGYGWDVHADLAAIVGADHVEARRARSQDASGLRGRAGALVRRAARAEVAAVVAWCYERDVAMIPVGGRSGYSGGIVPRPSDADAVAIALDRLDAIRSFDPLLWRMEAEAGVTTATVARRARENGLLFPPDPGAAEQSQLGGNLATNAGGPHAFKYGVTGRWVTGVEAVLAPGELVTFGGPVRKDVAGLDLRSLLIGSEGTLGIVTAAWLRLVPAPGEAFPVVGGVSTASARAARRSTRCWAAASCRRRSSTWTGAASRPRRRRSCDAPGAALLVVCEAESARDRDELLEALGPRRRVAARRTRSGAGARACRSRSAPRAARSSPRTSRCRSSGWPRRSRGRSRSARATAWRRCSWGHAGDGNLHSSFLLDPGDEEMRARADAAARDLFAWPRALGGTASGEHGIGLLKARAAVAAVVAGGGRGGARRSSARWTPRACSTRARRSRRREQPVFDRTRAR